MHIDFGMLFAAYIAALYGNAFVLALAIAICTDMVFGSLRAVRERKWNSSVGIDGGIRKIGMISAVLLLTALDMVLSVNLIGWVGDDIAQALSTIGIVKLGITELFSLLFVLYELTSILKNMVLCGLPIPRALREKLVHWLDDMTAETHHQTIQAPDEATPK